MRGYGQYCPIARGAEIFATRWTPIIVRNLLYGCRTYTELLDGAPGIPRSLLSQRLHQLERYGLVRKSPNPAGRGWRYQPTPACEDLRAVCAALGTWGSTWLETTEQHLDPYVALWTLSRGLASVRLPPGRVTLRFELSAAPRGQSRFWLLVQRPESEVCVQTPGFAEDVVIRTDPAWLAEWVQGKVSLRQGIRSEQVVVDGAPGLVRSLNGWAEAAAQTLVSLGSAASG